MKTENWLRKLVDPKENFIAAVADIPSEIGNDGNDLDALDALPTYQSVLTLPTGRLALGENQRAILAALKESEASAIVLVTRRALKSNEHLSLVQGAQKLYKHVRSVTVRSSLLVALYDQNMRGVKHHEERFSGEESPSALILEDMLERGIRVKCSDLHVCVRTEYDTAALLYRIHGKLCRLDQLPSSKATQALSYAYTKLADDTTRSEGTFIPTLFQFCAFPYQSGNRSFRIRWQTIPCSGGFDVVLRFLDNELDVEEKTLEDLGYAPSQCYELSLVARKSSGLFVVAGRTNSGKSTTIKTMGTLSPKRQFRKAYSVEDPVEYNRRFVTQISVQRSADDQHDDDNAFLAPMRSILRGDPDEITVGETRDRESGSLVKTMVQSGHKVNASLHCDSAIEVVERLASNEIGIARQVLGSRKFLAALMYQHLVPVLCSCKLPAKGNLPLSTVDQLECKFELSIDTMFVTNPKGCGLCNGTGIARLTVVAEVILPDRTMQLCFRDGRDQEAEDYYRSKRIHPFDHPDMAGKTALEHGLYKVSQGEVDPEALEEEFEPFELYEVRDIQSESTNVLHDVKGGSHMVKLAVKTASAEYPVEGAA